MTEDVLGKLRGDRPDTGAGFLYNVGFYFRKNIQYISTPIFE